MEIEFPVECFVVDFHFEELERDVAVECFVVHFHLRISESDIPMECDKQIYYSVESGIVERNLRVTFLIIRVRVECMNCVSINEGFIWRSALVCIYNIFILVAPFRCQFLCNFLYIIFLLSFFRCSSFG